MNLELDRSNWELVKFGDIAIQQKGKVDRETTTLTRYIAGEHMNSEDLHIRRWGELSEDYLGPAFHRKFEKGDILYGSRRTYLRKVAVAHFDGITSNTTFVIKANEKLIRRDLLPFVMLSEGFAQHSIKNSKGSVNPYVNWKDIASYEFLLPPKDQQARIAELLWAGDGVVERQVGLVGALTCLCQSTIHKFFSTRTASYLKLEQISEVKYGITLNSRRKKMDLQIPYLRVANVGRGIIDLEEIKEIGCSQKELDTYKLKRNDILIVEGHADISQIGRAAVWEKEEVLMLHQNHLIRVRNVSKVEPSVLESYINSIFGSMYFQRNAKSTSGLNTINSTVVKNLKIPLIDNTAQIKFLTKKEALDRSIEETKLQIDTSKSLQKSLINQIF